MTTMQKLHFLLYGLNALVFNSVPLIMNQCHIKERNKWSFAWNHLTKSKSRIEFFTSLFSVSSNLYVCIMNLNLCLPEGCLLNLSLFLCLSLSLCLFCLSVFVPEKSFHSILLNHIKKYHMGERMKDTLQKDSKVLQQSKLLTSAHLNWLR